MTTEEQRIAIAEFCGWRMDTSLGRTIWWPPGNRIGFHDHCPNYPADLNAMHEAESCLEGMTIDTKSLYLDYLALMHAELFEKKRDGLKRDPFDREWAVFRSTAAQRGEALLRTIGKWKE